MEENILLPYQFIINDIHDWDQKWGTYSFSMILLMDKENNLYNLKSSLKYFRKNGFNTSLCKKVNIDSEEFILLGSEKNILKIGSLKQV